MSRTLTVAAIQCRLGDDRATNVDRVARLVEHAADLGAQVICPPELFEGIYFCRTEEDRFFDLALPLDANDTIDRFAEIAARRGVALPISVFEREAHATYNSIVMLDADGSRLGVYRKSHIPDGPGYEEKYYFRPGDTGFKVWPTRFGLVGVGICWDQWYPECARAMALQGADVLLYPTAIGSEPNEVDTKDPWQRVMIGHAVANSTPVVAANRIGDEGGQVFYGHSFIADAAGDKVAELGRDDEGVILHTFDLDALSRRRGNWGFFRDRRPELYGRLATADGKLAVKPS